jgi:hypothetical protein
MEFDEATAMAATVDDVHGLVQAFSAVVKSSEVSKSTGQEREQWRKAIVKEYVNLVQNGFEPITDEDISRLRSETNLPPWLVSLSVRKIQQAEKRVTRRGLFLGEICPSERDSRRRTPSEEMRCAP